MSVDVTRRAVERLFAAIESRDLRRVEQALDPEVTWQNLPGPPERGRDAVIALLADILRWSDEVRWDVETAEFEDATARVVRLDRFVIDGAEHAVHCDGEFDVDTAAGTVTAIRDRADLVAWRARITPVYDRLRSRDAVDVVERHLRAVHRRDPIAMAADYSLDATLERAGTLHAGWAAVADYFDTVPDRLAGRSVRFGTIESHGDGRAAVDWVITDGSSTVAAGRDTFDTEDGFISGQVVDLERTDF